MENISNNNDISKNDNATLEQVLGVSKWTRFIGIVFLLISTTVLLTCLFLLFNFDTILNEMARLNGISSEMIQIMDNGGKIALIFFMIVCVIVLFLNGFLLLRFGLHSANKNVLNETEEGKQVLNNAFIYLNKYLKLSIILGIISMSLSILYMLALTFSKN